MELMELSNYCINGECKNKKRQERWIKNDDLNRTIDRHEQQSRRNCSLVHGIKESKSKDTDVIVTEILNKPQQEKFTTVVDIDRSHRIGKLKKDKQSRSIIIKFSWYYIRNRVFENKKVERRWYQHNREPHSKTNANANQSKKRVFIQKCLDTPWKNFNEIT